MVIIFPFIVIQLHYYYESDTQICYLAIYQYISQISILNFLRFTIHSSLGCLAIDYMLLLNPFPYNCSEMSLILDAVRRERYPSTYHQFIPLISPVNIPVLFHSSSVLGPVIFCPLDYFLFVCFVVFSLL